jgi:hypothetical protein
MVPCATALTPQDWRDPYENRVPNRAQARTWSSTGEPLHYTMTMWQILGHVLLPLWLPCNLPFQAQLRTPLVARGRGGASHRAIVFVRNDCCLPDGSEYTQEYRNLSNEQLNPCLSVKTIDGIYNDAQPKTVESSGHSNRDRHFANGRVIVNQLMQVGDTQKNELT